MPSSQDKKDRADAPDVIVVGGGAAGLTAAIRAARQPGGDRVLILERGGKAGAKLLLCGGGRCNVTNRHVSEKDFHGGSRNAVRKILRAVSRERIVSFFDELGVRLKEEEDGKMFPHSNRAADVRSALVREAARLGVQTVFHEKVTEMKPEGGGVGIRTEKGNRWAAKVILATGGRSFPKTGSDGSGYGLAAALGHSVSTPVPALEPWVLEGDFHRSLQGLSLPVELSVRAEGEKVRRFSGSLLWTHFGVSGPVVLDASRWRRLAVGARRGVEVSVSFLPGKDPRELERKLRPETGGAKTSVRRAAGRGLPGKLMTALLERAGVAKEKTLSHLTKEERRSIVNGLTGQTLEIRDGRGFDHAEITAGGVPLVEVNPATMASRKTPGLFLAGEILDVDGPVGGFNLHWAWATGWLAGEAVRPAGD